MQRETRVEIGFDSKVSDSVVRWTDVTEDFASLDCGRGRSKELDTIEAAECTIRLDNADGRYTPGRAASPYAGKIKPRKPVRARTIIDNNLLHFESVNASNADLDQPRWQKAFSSSSDTHQLIQKVTDADLDRDVFQFTGPPSTGQWNFWHGIAGDSDVIHVKAGDVIRATGLVRCLTGDFAFIGVSGWAYGADPDGDPTHFGGSATVRPDEGWTPLATLMRVTFDGFIRVRVGGSSRGTDQVFRGADFKVVLNAPTPEPVGHPSSGTYPVFRGYVDTWVTEYDGELAHVEIKAVDALSVLTRPLSTYCREYIKHWYRHQAADPGDSLHYWTCVDAADDMFAEPTIGSLRLDVVRSATPPATGGFTDNKTFEFADGTSGGFTVADDNPAVGAVLRLVNNGFPVAPFNWAPSDAKWATSFWFKGDRPATGRSALFIMADSSATPTVALYLNASGTVTAEYAGNGLHPDLTVTSTKAAVTNGVPVLLEINVRVNKENGTTSLAVQHDGSGYSATAFAYHPISNPAYVTYGGRLFRTVSGDFMRGTINHIMWMTGEYAYYGTGEMSSAGDEDIFMEDYRISTILDFVDFPGSRVLDPGVSELLRSQWEDATDANGLLSDTAGSAGGTFFIGPAGEATSHNRYRRIGVPTRWDLSEWADGLRFELDSSRVINVVRAERSTGLYREAVDQDSIDDHGVKAVTIRRDVTDEEEVRQAAGWVLHRYRESSPRCEVLTIDATALDGPDDAQLVALAHGAAVSDRIQLHDLPASAPAPVLSFFVEGIQTSIDVDGSQLRYKTTLQVSDASRSEAWILEDDTTGRLDTESCVAVY